MNVYFLTKEREVIKKNITTPTKWLAYNEAIYRIDDSSVGISKTKETLSSDAEIIFNADNPFPLFTTEQDEKKLGSILEAVLIRNIIEQTTGARQGFSFKNISGWFSNFSIQKLIPFLAIPIGIYAAYIVIQTIMSGGHLFFALI